MKCFLYQTLSVCPMYRLFWSAGLVKCSREMFQFQFLKNCLKMMVSFPCGRISTCVFILG